MLGSQLLIEHQKLFAYKNVLAATLSALQHFGLTAEVLTVKSKSGIAEQPFDDETIRGAENRARDAARLSPGADLVIAISTSPWFLPFCPAEKRNAS